MRQPRHSSSRRPRRPRPSLTAGMAICNFRNDSEPRGASCRERERERERRTRLVLSFLRPFVLSGKRAARIDYVPDWRLDGAIMASLSLRELRFEMLVKYRRNQRPGTRSGVRFLLSFFLPQWNTHSVDRELFFSFIAGYLVPRRNVAFNFEANYTALRNVDAHVHRALRL